MFCVCLCAGVAFTILMLLASLNSCTNPWIYTAFSSSVSTELQNLLQCRSGLGRRGSLPDDSTTTHTSTTKDTLWQTLMRWKATQWHIWKRHAWLHTHALLEGRDIAHNPANITAATFSDAARADLYQMFQTAEDNCIVNRALSLITYPLHHSSEKRWQWKCQHDFIAMRVVVAGSIYNAKVQIFAPQLQLNVWEKCFALLRQSRVTGMQGEDHGINSLLARLMYKAADKAMSI